ncbi:GGDEF domain-containing protein [Thomasclavelia sp.]|uniref:sensor domain-containing diguanylate cyclase n=1 Tax=Thomasclavelia sp. TaxID=3025757 RepID=UPI0025DC0A81|nr:GGDEF domain-containing protein [Thomasclavelia sp.]
MNMYLNGYYEEILNHIHSGVLYCRNDSFLTILYANDYFYKMIGYHKDELKNLFENHLVALIEDDVDKMLTTIEDTISRSQDLDFELKLKKKNGEIFWVHNTAKYDRGNSCWYVTIMDITEMKTLDYERKRLKFYLDSIPSKIVITDQIGQIVYQNKWAKNCFYYDDKANNLQQLIERHILIKQYEQIFNDAVNGQTVKYETRYQNQDHYIGHDKNYLIPIESKSKKEINFMQVSEDLLSYSDSLTMLPTRMMFEYYYKEYLKDYHGSVYLGIVDIDDFKQVNDNYGHVAGDQAIKLTGDRLFRLLGKDDYICRYGGDEFVLLFLNQDKYAIERKYAELLKMSQEPLVFKDNYINLSYSVGMTKVMDLIDFENALKKADQVLYEVKQNGKNQMMFSI